MRVLFFCFVIFSLTSCSSVSTKKPSGLDTTIKPTKLNRLFVSRDRKLIKELILNANRSITYRGDVFDRVDSILKNICQSNNIEVCPALILLSSTNILSPYVTLYTIVVSQGTINAIPSDDQLAFILGHELSHITHGHTKQFNESKIVTGFKNIMEITGISYMDDDPVFPIVLGADPSTYVATIAQFMFVSPLIIRTARRFETSLYKFDREMEYQADISSIELIRKAKYNPWASVSFWKGANKIFGEDKQQNNSWGISNNIIITKTHPTYNNRILNLKLFLSKKT